MKSPKAKILSWILQFFSALIMLQTLFFKFTGSEESVYIFSTLKMEPEGRIGTGIIELLASVLLLIPSLSWAGAIIGVVLMSGAIYFHFTPLGFEVMNDGGYLFVLALTVFFSCLTIIYIRRNQISLISRFNNREEA